ncbi:hypothetical protein ACFLSJ_08625, partial [Verrucomicrobiota bacterium]
ALGDELLPLLRDEEDRKRLKSMALDGSFVIEDYERSLATVEAGIPGRDEAWHEMALNKIKAHLALQEGRTDEAVTRFRRFMQDVEATWEEAEEDPSTGIKHTREMSLGFNARRIGDILSEAGQTDAAREAYREARSYCAKALELLDETSREHAMVRERLASMPPEAE